MKRHVLVVDDALSVQKIVEVALGRIGFAVTVAADTAAGVGVMRSVLHPLVVLLDCAPPPNDHLRLLPGALADPWIGQRHAFILLDTPGANGPHPDLAAIAQALPQGTPVLRKPIRVPDLVRQVLYATQRVTVP